MLKEYLKLDGYAYQDGNRARIREIGSDALGEHSVRRERALRAVRHHAGREARQPGHQHVRRRARQAREPAPAAPRALPGAAHTCTPTHPHTYAPTHPHTYTPTHLHFYTPTRRGGLPHSAGRAAHTAPAQSFASDHQRAAAAAACTRTPTTSTPSHLHTLYTLQLIHGIF